MNQRVDVLNFFLIWICLGLALVWPFELFLFSYIVLGPLHYLTEINWLDKQNYFLRAKDRRNFIWTMAIVVTLLWVLFLMPQLDKWETTRPLHKSLFENPNPHFLSFREWSYILILLSFVMSAAWVLTERWPVRTMVMLFCLVSSFLFYRLPAMVILLGVLLPTIVHVFFFTICFMLYGALKSKSNMGYVNVASMFLGLVVIALLGPVPNTLITQKIAELLKSSGFDMLNFSINNSLGNVKDGRLDAVSPAFMKVQAFLAFAYTYHYLNWFSKTSIIKWHHVARGKLAMSIVLWLTAVSLFGIDYRLGFAAGFALSTLHVFLEFPLNYVSIHGVFNSLTLKTRAAFK